EPVRLRSRLFESPTRTAQRFARDRERTMNELPRFSSHARFARRDLIKRGAAGFGMIGLASTLLQARALSAAEGDSGVRMHHAARAKRVIFLFMNGAPSHVDTFDPKPALAKHAGEEPPE